MVKHNWLARSLAVSLLASAGSAYAQEAVLRETDEPEAYEKPPRPEKPPIQIVESGPFKMKDKRGYRNLIILGPRLIPPGIGGRYIRSLDDHISVMVGGGYAGWSLFGAEVRHLDARAGIDYQPIGNGMHGFFMGPRAVYRSFLASGDTSNGDSGLAFTTASVGGVMGWRAIWNPGISLGAGLGATYTTFVADAGALDNDNTLSMTGTAPLLELTAGFAF